MDSSSAVTTNSTLAIVGFALVIIALLLLIARFKWHVFLSLLVPIVLFGFLPSVDREQFITAFELGFGKTLGKIGVVIVLGSVIAEGLRHTGAIQVITRSMVDVVGAKRMPLALTLAGFVLGVAIFSDVAFVILNPLVHSSASAMRVSIVTMSTGLAGALQLTHAIVPPTPGPLAAAALVDADIGLTIVFGGIACLAGSLASWAWGQFVVGPRIKTPPSIEFSASSLADQRADQLPGTWSSYAPIMIPIVLISTQTIVKTTLDEENVVRGVLGYIGWPVVALSIGVWLAYRNIATREDRAKARSAWVEEALRNSAMILVVTGLGGSLSEVLKGTPTVNTVADFFQTWGLPAILLPFVLGVAGNMITGSSTVGVITAASLVAPMIGTLGLSPEAAMLSGGCGSVIFKYVNSSYFWVCTSLTRVAVSDAILSYGGATFVGGLASFAAVWTLWALGWM